MTIPRTVQRQLEVAEAHLAAQNAQPAGPQIVDNPSQLAALAPEPVPAAPAPTPPAQAPAQEPWEQRFRSVQGMYNAEVPALRSQLKAAESDVVQLKQQVQVLMTAQQAKPAEPKKLEVDPRDADAFGADMVAMVQRYAQQTYSDMRTEFANHVTSMDARLRAVEESLTGVTKKTETTLETQFVATLRQMVPDYEQINLSQDWLMWLGEVDPVYRVARQAALDSASSRLDAEAVAAIFKAFKAHRPASPSAALAGQQSPGNSGGASPPAPEQQKPVLSQKFVNTFYGDQAKGRYRGREAEMARIEAEINQAAAEGRIV